MQSNKVINLRLSLFAFYSRNSLVLHVGKNVSNDFTDNVELLWAQYKSICQGSGIDSSHVFRPPDFSSIDNSISTYMLDFTVRHKECIDIKQLADFNFKNCLTLEKAESLIGQCLLLFVQPVCKIDDCREFADKCLSSLLPESEFERYQAIAPVKGELLESPIFEYTNQGGTKTVLVWIGSNPTTQPLEEQNDYFHPLTSLFHCRQRLLHVYDQAKQCNDRIWATHSKLEDSLQDLKQLKLGEGATEGGDQKSDRLSTFGKCLTALPILLLDYTYQIKNLEAHCAALEADAEKYNFWLSKITEDFADDDLSGLNAWESFSLDALEMYSRIDNCLQAIQHALEQLAPSSKSLDKELLNNLIQACGLSADLYF